MIKRRLRLRAHSPERGTALHGRLHASDGNSIVSRLLKLTFSTSVAPLPPVYTNSLTREIGFHLISLIHTERAQPETNGFNRRYRPLTPFITKI